MEYHIRVSLTGLKPHYMYKLWYRIFGMYNLSNNVYIINNQANFTTTLSTFAVKREDYCNMTSEFVVPIIAIQCLDSSHCSEADSTTFIPHSITWIPITSGTTNVKCILWNPYAEIIYERDTIEVSVSPVSILSSCDKTTSVARYMYIPSKTLKKCLWGNMVSHLSKSFWVECDARIQANRELINSEFLQAYTSYYLTGMRLFLPQYAYLQKKDIALSNWDLLFLLQLSLTRRGFTIDDWVVVWSNLHYTPSSSIPTYFNERTNEIIYGALSACVTMAWLAVYVQDIDPATSDDIEQLGISCKSSLGISGDCDNLSALCIAAFQSFSKYQPNHDEKHHELYDPPLQALKELYMYYIPFFMQGILINTLTPSLKVDMQNIWNLHDEQLLPLMQGHHFWAMLCRYDWVDTQVPVQYRSFARNSYLECQFNKEFVCYLPETILLESTNPCAICDTDIVNTAEACIPMADSLSLNQLMPWDKNTWKYDYCLLFTMTSLITPGIGVRQHSQCPIDITCTQRNPVTNKDESPVQMTKWIKQKTNWHVQDIITSADTGVLPSIEIKELMQLEPPAFSPLHFTHKTFMKLQWDPYPRRCRWATISTHSKELLKLFKDTKNIKCYKIQQTWYICDFIPTRTEHFKE